MYGRSIGSTTSLRRWPACIALSLLTNVELPACIIFTLLRKLEAYHRCRDIYTTTLRLRSVQRVEAFRVMALSIHTLLCFKLCRPSD